MAKQYTEYDVEKANEHLDRAGYTERDDDGIRIGPDGNPISFQVQNPSNAGVGGFNSTDALELIEGYWREVGIDMRIDNLSRDLWVTRLYANELDAHWWTGDGGLEVLLVPQFYFPYGTQVQFAMLWGEWYESQGEQGERPPEAPRRQMELYDRIQTTIDEDEQVSLMEELLRITREEFYIIGVNLTPEGYGIVKNDFRNVPETIVDSYWYGSLHNTNPEQYYFTNGG
jgi:peptide/nickel transport system substrate-binding protein